MGYLSPHIIDSIVYQKTVYGLKVFVPKEFDYLCNGCANGKSYCLPLSGSNASQYSKMELLVMNLTRSISIPTWDEYLYVVEVSYHYIAGHLLKKKEEASIAI